MIELQSIPKCQKKDSINLGNYTCINNKPAYRICTQKDCPHPSLCCQDDDCTCNELHSRCSQIRLKSLLQKLYSKVADTSEIMSKVTNLFDSIIDQVSQIYEETQKKIKRYGLRHAQIKFLSYLEENRSHTLTGKIVNDANQIASIKFDGDFWQIQRVVDKLWNQLGGLFWSMLYSTKDMYEMPTRVNRLNPDSGQEFFADMVQQTKLILVSLQDMKVRDKKQMRQRSRVQNKQKKQQRKVQEIKKVEQLKFQDLGYSDDEKNNIEQNMKQVQRKQVQIQNDLQLKPQKKKSQKVQEKIENQKENKMKKQQEQPQDIWQKILANRILQKNQRDEQKNLQIKQNQVIRQRQNPILGQGLNNQLQNQDEQKPILNQKRGQGIKNNFLFQKVQQKRPVQEDKQFNQACQYLNQNLGIGMRICKLFVLKSGFNQKGDLLSMEQILDKALTDGSLFN